LGRWLSDFAHALLEKKRFTFPGHAPVCGMRFACNFLLGQIIV
jgi:hypothetical protein